MGGVSLAVYMNGTVTELWHALRASQSLRQREPSLPGRDKNPDDLKGTAAVYRELLERLRAVPGCEDLRIVVDAIAGTSAGGVNGGVLGKAIVDGGDAGVLNEVWIDEADISNLRSEPQKSPRVWLRLILGGATTFCPYLARLRRKIESYPGLGWEWVRDTIYTLVTTKDGTVTPLNGRYFAEMIAKTYRKMGAVCPCCICQSAVTRPDWSSSSLASRRASTERANADSMNECARMKPILSLFGSMTIGFCSNASCARAPEPSDRPLQVRPARPHQSRDPSF